MLTSVCKNCRSANQKLFLKGEKCYSPKCSLVRKPYSPGQKSKKSRKSFSEYGKELMEKQKLKRWYGLGENQFAKYVKGVLAQRGRVEDASLELIKKLEKRLDNVVWRLGFARSRRQARQLVGHCYFLVNEKRVNIPSFEVKKGDIISVKEQKKNKTFFKEVSLLLKNIQAPSWLKLDKTKIQGEIIGDPSFEETGVPVEISSVFEFYSR